MGNSENAVKTQVWCAVATYVLIANVSTPGVHRCKAKGGPVTYSDTMPLAIGDGYCERIAR
jgi:hypothetical protein